MDRIRLLTFFQIRLSSCWIAMTPSEESAFLGDATGLFGSTQSLSPPPPHGTAWSWLGMMRSPETFIRPWGHWDRSWPMGPWMGPWRNPAMKILILLLRSIKGIYGDYHDFIPLTIWGYISPLTSFHWFFIRPGWSDPDSDGTIGCSGCSEFLWQRRRPEKISGMPCEPVPSPWRRGEGWQWWRWERMRVVYASFLQWWYPGWYPQNHQFKF